MKLHKLGLLILITILVSTMSGCSGLIPTGKSINNQVAQAKAQEMDKAKELERAQEFERQREKAEQMKMEQERQRKEALQQKIRDYITTNNVSGSILVAQNNQVLFNEGIGYANAEKKLPNEPSTTYPIGSITKIFVAVSIMMLQEQHKLSIQDPISKYIPDFPNGNQLQLYHFLTHTSGIQKLQWNKTLNSPAKLVQEIKKMPLKFTPGEKWDYLDANYMVLGYVVEKTAGEPLHDFIQKNIIDKVPLKDTGFITTEHPLPYNSISYNTKEDNKVETTQWLSANSLYGCGDIYSTAYDVSQFDHALMDGELLSKDSLNQILTPSPRSKYGLGLYNDGEAAYSIGVLGGWYIMHSYYNDQTSIVICLNVRNKSTNIGNLTNDIYKIVQASSNPEEPRQLNPMD